MAAHKKTHCHNGHPRTPENLTTGRGCVLCDRLRKSRPEWKTRTKELRIMHQENLTNKYLNHLISMKSGLPYTEIYEEDRQRVRERIRSEREKLRG